MAVNKKVGYAKNRISHLKKITAAAKKLYATGRYKKWTDAISAASKLQKPVAKKVAPKRKTAPKKIATKKSAPKKIGVVSAPVLSAYNLVWTVLVSVRGRITKTDQIKINRYLDRGGIPAMFPFSLVSGKLLLPGIRGAKYVSLLQNKNPIKKAMVAYEFTDKQFGLAGKVKADIEIGGSNWVKLTEMQKKAAKFIL